MSLVGVVRAAVLRTAILSYIRARAERWRQRSGHYLRHMLPNAMVRYPDILPFILCLAPSPP